MSQSIPDTYSNFNQKTFDGKQTSGYCARSAVMNNGKLQQTRRVTVISRPHVSINHNKSSELPITFNATIQGIITGPAWSRYKTIPNTDAIRVLTIFASSGTPTAFGYLFCCCCCCCCFMMMIANYYFPTYMTRSRLFLVVNMLSTWAPIWCNCWLLPIYSILNHSK